MVLTTAWHRTLCLRPNEMRCVRRSIAAAAAASLTRATGAATLAPLALSAATAPLLSTRPSVGCARHQSTEALAAELVSACDEKLAAGKRINWVFLGAPGVGKGTYATRVSKLMNIPHISAGDLVREEIKRGTPLGQQVRAEPIEPNKRS